MKIISRVTALFLSAFLVACQPSTPPASEAVATPTAATAPTVDTAALIDAYMAAWNAHDADKAASYFTDTVVYLDASVGTPQNGKQAVTDNILKVFMGAAPDCKWARNGNAIATADGIAFEWTFTGTNTGAWGPETPATNKPFSFNGVTFIRIVDGKISYQADYYDALSFSKQLGWIQ